MPIRYFKTHDEVIWTRRISFRKPKNHPRNFRQIRATVQDVERRNDRGGYALIEFYDRFEGQTYYIRAPVCHLEHWEPDSEPDSELQ